MEDDVRRLAGAEEDTAGRSLIESSRRERMFAASHAAFAIGDAFSFASRWVGVSCVVEAVLWPATFVGSGIDSMKIPYLYEVKESPNFAPRQWD